MTDEAGRRRRRRRLGMGEPAPRDENRMPSTPMALLNEQQTLDGETELPVTPEVSFAANSKAGWIDKPERTKPIKPEPVKPVIEPPQTVYVEMLPEEQEVYALMGVSPLVRANQEVKNPKSVIVQVTLPGQIPDTSTVSENGTPAPVLTPELTAPETETVVATEQFESLDTPSVDTSPIATTESESEATDKMAVRRRRRRSSATENSPE